MLNDNEKLLNTRVRYWWKYQKIKCWSRLRSCGGWGWMRRGYPSSPLQGFSGNSADFCEGELWLGLIWTPLCAFHAHCVVLVSLYPMGDVLEWQYSKVNPVHVTSSRQWNTWIPGTCGLISCWRRMRVNCISDVLYSPSFLSSSNLLVCWDLDLLEFVLLQGVEWGNWWSQLVTRHWVISNHPYMYQVDWNSSMS